MEIQATLDGFENVLMRSAQRFDAVGRIDGAEGVRRVFDVGVVVKGANLRAENVPGRGDADVHAVREEGGEEARGDVDEGEGHAPGQ